MVSIVMSSPCRKFGIQWWTASSGIPTRPRLILNRVYIYATKAPSRNQNEPNKSSYESMGRSKNHIPYESIDISVQPSHTRSIFLNDPTSIDPKTLPKHLIQPIIDKIKRHETHKSPKNMTKVYDINMHKFVQKHVSAKGVFTPGKLKFIRNVSYPNLLKSTNESSFRDHAALLELKEKEKEILMNKLDKKKSRVEKANDPLKDLEDAVEESESIPNSNAPSELDPTLSMRTRNYQLQTAPLILSNNSPYFPEVAFVGIANVGKSKLINAIAQSTIVKSKAKAGTTESLDFFVIQNASSTYSPFPGVAPSRAKNAIVGGFVDMPGYGFSEKSTKVRENWLKMAYRYFELRTSPKALQEYLNSSQSGVTEPVEYDPRDLERLKRVFVLVDCRYGVKSNDIQFMEILESFKIKFHLIFTKCDYAEEETLARHAFIAQDVLKRFRYAVPDVLMASSVTEVGIDRIRNIIFHAWGVPAPDVKKVEKERLAEIDEMKKKVDSYTHMSRGKRRQLLKKQMKLPISILKKK